MKSDYGYATDVVRRRVAGFGRSRAEERAGVVDHRPHCRLHPAPFRKLSPSQATKSVTIPDEPIVLAPCGRYLVLAP